MSNYPRLCGVNYESFVDGDGMRATFFFAGCPHHCPGCHNPETWDENGGIEITEETIREFAEEIKKRPFLKGITISGGDPFMNPEKTCKFIADLMFAIDESLLHPPNIWCYTGYTWNQIMHEKKCGDWGLLLVGLINVLVDGRFIQSKADRTLPFCGSTNQRVIDVDKTFELGHISRWKKEAPVVPITNEENPKEDDFHD